MFSRRASYACTATDFSIRVLPSTENTINFLPSASSHRRHFLISINQLNVYKCKLEWPIKRSLASNSGSSRNTPRRRQQPAYAQSIAFFDGQQDRPHQAHGTIDVSAFKMLPSRAEKVRIVCVSDTHGRKPGEGFTLPAGDVLIHAGDLTNQGGHQEMLKAVRWIADACFEVKIVIGGNHDLSLDANYHDSKHKEHAHPTSEPQYATDETRNLLLSNPNITYLEHSAARVTIPSKKISLNVFGSPYSPTSPSASAASAEAGAAGESDSRFAHSWAFQYEPQHGPELWRAIPAAIDILVTHAPPHGIHDASAHWGSAGGCRALADTLERVRPRLHVCGHCHEGRGAEVLHWERPRAREGMPPPQWQLSRRDAWVDPGCGSKKQSLLDLTGVLATAAAAAATGGDATAHDAGDEEAGPVASRAAKAATAVVNASIMATSHGRGPKAFNKPIVVDVMVPT